VGETRGCWKCTCSLLQNLKGRAHVGDGRVIWWWVLKKWSVLIGCKWFGLAANGWALVDTIMNFRMPWYLGNFLSRRATSNFSWFSFCKRVNHGNVWLVMKEEFCLLRTRNFGCTSAFEIDKVGYIPFDFKHVYVGRNCFDINQVPRTRLYHYSDTNVMHFLFNWLRIKGLYMFRALLAHPQEALHKRHLVYCLRVMLVGCTRTGAAN
jgi:hypothetical protein